jgi:hypothetical protein
MQVMRSGEQPDEDPRSHERGREAQAAGRQAQDQAARVVNEVELRLATLPTAFGEKLVMRIFDPDVLQRSFETTGAARMKTWPAGRPSSASTTASSSSRAQPAAAKPPRCIPR